MENNFLKENFPNAHKLYYNYFISSYTSKIYNSLLKKVENYTTIIDIGIRNGDALFTEENIKLILGKRIQIYGYDISKENIKEIRKKVDENFLTYNVFVFYKDLVKDNYIFTQHADYLIMNNSYAVKNSSELLKKCVKIFRPNDIIISTSLDEEKSNFGEYIKPNLKYFTFGVDFGKTYLRKQFESEVENAGLKINKKEISCKPSFMGITFNVWTYYLKSKKKNFNYF